jgi:hypothetical protein
MQGTRRPRRRRLYRRGPPPRGPPKASAPRRASKSPRRNPLGELSPVAPLPVHEGADRLHVAGFQALPDPDRNLGDRPEVPQHRRGSVQRPLHETPVGARGEAGLAGVGHDELPREALCGNGEPLDDVASRLVADAQDAASESGPEVLHPSGDPEVRGLEVPAEGGGERVLHGPPGRRAEGQEERDGHRRRAPQPAPRGRVAPRLYAPPVRDAAGGAEALDEGQPTRRRAAAPEVIRTEVPGDEPQAGLPRRPHLHGRRQADGRVDRGCVPDDRADGPEVQAPPGEVHAGRGAGDDAGGAAHLAPAAWSWRTRSRKSLASWP